MKKKKKQHPANMRRVVDCNPGIATHIFAKFPLYHSNLRLKLFSVISCLFSVLFSVFLGCSRCLGTPPPNAFYMGTPVFKMRLQLQAPVGYSVSQWLAVYLRDHPLIRRQKSTCK